MRRERLIRPTVQTCRHDQARQHRIRHQAHGVQYVQAPYPTYGSGSVRHDKTRQRRIRHRRTVPDAPRDASDNNLLFHHLADRSNNAGSSMVVRSSRIASFANRLDRAAQHFSGSHWQLRDKPIVRRAAKVANLAVHQRHNRLLLRVRQHHDLPTVRSLSE